MPQVPADRRVEHMVERGLVEPARDGLFFVERFRLVPGGDLGFDLWNVRRADNRVLAVGAKPPVGRVEEVYAEVAG